MPEKDSNTPSTKLKKRDPSPQKTESGWMELILTVVIGGSLLGLIGGTGGAADRSVQGIMITIMFIVGAAAQGYTGGFIGKILTGTDEGFTNGMITAIVLFVFGLSPYLWLVVYFWNKF